MTPPKSFTKQARHDVWSRQNGDCTWCGKPMDLEHYAAHHRLLRGQGGSWALSNIVGTHHDCHNVQPASIHQNPRSAYALGVMIRTKRLTPAELPVFDRARGSWWLLNDAGTREPVNEWDALELLDAAGSLTRSRCLVCQLTQPCACTIWPSVGSNESSKTTRIESKKSGPADAETSVIPGLTPTKEGLMVQSTYSPRQTATGGVG